MKRSRAFDRNLLAVVAHIHRAGQAVRKIDDTVGRDWGIIHLADYELVDIATRQRDSHRPVEFIYIRQRDLLLANTRAGRVNIRLCRSRLNYSLFRRALAPVMMRFRDAKTLGTEKQQRAGAENGPLIVS